MPIDTEITTALIALAVIIIGGFGSFIKVMIDHVVEELKNNTTISTQARDVSNGRLSEIMNKLAAERNTVVGLRAVVWDRDDQIAFLIARMPEANALLKEYRDRRTRRSSEADIQTVERNLLSERGEPS